MFRQADFRLTNPRDEEAVELGIVGVGKAGLQRIWAMAVGLTDHRPTMEELVTYPIWFLASWTEFCRKEGLCS